MKSFFDLPLAVRQTVILLALLAVIGGGLGFWLYDRSEAMLFQQVDAAASHAVSASAEKINAIFPAVEAAATEFASQIELLRPDEATQKQMLAGTLRRLREKIPALCSISIAYVPFGEDPQSFYCMYFAHLDARDNVVVDRIGSDEYMYHKFDWFVVPQALDRAIWTEPYLDAYTKVIMSTYSQPIRDRQGKFRGMTGFDLSLQGIENLASSADVYGYGSEILLSRFGGFIAVDRDNPDFRITGKPASIFSCAETMPECRDELYRIGKAMLRGQSGSERIIAAGLNGGDNALRCYYAPVPTPGWSIGVFYPERLLLAPLRALAWQNGLIAAVGALVLLLTLWVVNRQLAAPLRRLTRAAKAVGGGNFNVALPQNRHHDEIGELGDAFVHMQSELVNYISELQATTAARQRIESELTVARDIQQSILPKMLPPLPDAPEFQVWALLRPAREVGGDLYDLFALDERHYVFIIGDVSGKGIPAALFMAVTQTLQRSESERHRDSGELVERMNELLSRNNDAMMFVTYFIGVLDTVTGEMVYTNAGHNYPCVRRAGGGIELLTARHGTPLGIRAGRRYGSQKLQLHRGDTLLLYTDGIVEATNPGGNEFGMDSLLHVLEKSGGKTPEGLGGDILNAVDAHAGGAEQFDDITMLILQYKGE